MPKKEFGTIRKVRGKTLRDKRDATEKIREEKRKAYNRGKRNAT